MDKATEKKLLDDKFAGMQNEAEKQAKAHLKERYEKVKAQGEEES